MAKKIDHALADLVKAAQKHAAVASDKKAPKGKLQRSAGKLRAAAIAYGIVVAARTGADSPFADIVDPRLDEPTVNSLRAERDALAERRGKKGKGADAPTTGTTESQSA